MRTFAVVMLGLLVSAPAIAQQDSARVVPIDTLAVTVTRGSTSLARVPAAVSIVARERIQAGRLGVTLDEALSDVPGVFVNNRYNFALGTRISLRGFGARAAFGVRGIRLIGDGIPLTMPDGQSNLNNIDLTSVGRIEVLRGAASMLHGNAAGGVIALRSELPQPGYALEARAIGADLGRKGLDDLARFNIKLGGGSEQTRYLLSAARVDASGSRDHSRHEQNNVTARVEHVPGNGARTALTLSIADAPVAQNPGSLPRDSAELKPQMAWPRNVATLAGEKSRQIQLGVEHERALMGGRFNATVYGLTRTLDNPLPFAYITLDRKSGGLRSAVSWQVVTAGFDLELQADERAEFNNDAGRIGVDRRRDQTDRIVSFGPFIRASINASDRVTLSAGARYDRARFEVDDRFFTDQRDDSGDRSMSAFSPSVGVTYALAANTTLFGSFSTSFQTPTTTELINAPPAAGQPCCAAGFNQLDPQRARSFEAGVRSRPSDRLQVEAAAYYTRIRDALVPFQVAQAEGREFFRNAGRTRHSGVEIAATTQLSQALQVTTSYTYGSFIFVDDGSATTDNEGNRIPGVPPHHFNGRLELRTLGAVIEPELDVVSSYFADDANSAGSKNDGVAVVNLRIRPARSVGNSRLTPFAAFNNITDARYNGSVVVNAAGGRFFEPAPGRNVFIGLAFRVEAR